MKIFNMGQAEVYKLLIKENVGLTTEEVAKKLNTSRQSTFNALSRLFKYKEITRKIIRNQKINKPNLAIWRIK